ncbi:FMN-dependent oxidoreductase (nitrilotriacetate monooxygenase family) [Rhodococcus sp. 27YEA15]|uniref:NtaA/DmoA family FMN-dependent monooxygenase n=1 Tax=Rhodococcus sp. 27YEA15 TaxID=3156259 RepID=UPI003C7BE6EF
MTDIPKPLLFNAFVQNTVSHIHHGQWRHPDARQADFENVDVWVDLARTLEAGRFDAMFFADVVGLYGADPNGSYEVNVREGLQIPNHDPAILLAALAVSTEHLGLAYTSNIVQQHPFHFARQISTLDHISRGRIAWNIVTGTLENGARNFGQSLTEHDERYRWAQEYVDVAYKLWEGSWDDGALLKDRERGIYADPSKVHKIDHRGERYRVDGPHLPSPSPQRTPLLFQAGASAAGKAFAAANAEAVFIAASNPAVAADGIRETRALAVARGREPEDILFFQGLSFVIGSTEEEAKRLESDLDEYVSLDGYLAHMDFGAKPDGTRYAPETKLADIETEDSRSLLNWLLLDQPDREPTVADIGPLFARRGRVVGTPEQIADQLALWQQAGVDGINVFNWRIPDTYTSFIDHVMPVLRQRGLAKQEYTPGTLRRKLFGTDQLGDRHPAARYRSAFAEHSLVEEQQG